MSMQPHVERIFADYIVEAGCLRDQDVIFEGGVHKCEYAINVLPGFQMPHHLSVGNIRDCIVGKEMELRLKANNSSWAFFACETGFNLLQEDLDGFVYVGFILHHCGH